MRTLTLLLILGLSGVLASAAGCGKSEEEAGGTKAGKAGSPTSEVPPEGNPHKGFCPVMGNKVDYEKANTDPALHFDYEGKRYYFCCAGCKSKFKADPQKYIDNPVEPQKTGGGESEPESNE